MTITTALVVPMESQQVLDRDRIIGRISGGIRQGRDFGRRRLDLVPKNGFAQPDRPINRVRSRTRGITHQNGALCQEASKPMFRFDRNGTELQSGHAFDSIMDCKGFVEVGKFRIDDIEDARVFANQFAHEPLRLLKHVIANGRTEQLFLSAPLSDMHGIEKPGKEVTVDVHRFHLGDAQPLGGKVSDKTQDPRVGQKPACLSLDDSGSGKLSRGSEIKQFLIGHASPKEIGKPRGEFVLLRRAVVINHQVIKKLRRNQDHRKGLSHRLFKGIELRVVDLVDSLIVINFLLAHRTPERPRHETLDHLACVLIGISRPQR